MSVPTGQMTGALAAMDEGVDKGSGQLKIEESELKAVAKVNADYNVARGFDETARRQYHRDRKYASGKSDRTWKSNANIIGSHIDILKSFTYAQNPDVSCRPGEKAGMAPTEDDVAFAETMQIVISKLWKRAALKKKARRQVGSVLTVGPGVIKALMYSDKRQNPQLEREVKDMRDNMARITALEVELSEEFDTEEDKDAKIEELENQLKGLEAKVEKLTSKGLCLDFVRAEDFQVSTDVTTLADHLDADWNADNLYVRKDQLRTKFPRLTATDVTSAVTYYQTAPKQADTGTIYTGETRRDDEGSADGAFTKSSPSQNASGTVVENGKPVEFARVTEMWCRSENVIKTFVDGVKRWAREPYAPPQGSQRYYPYFLLEFYEVDGERHPQSLTERLIKLQDEYASRRSNGAEVCERSVPLKIFNSGMLDEANAEKIRKGQNMEMVGVQLTDPTADVGKAVTVLQSAPFDPLVYDTTPIQRDIETMSGVQEAMQQAPKSGVTATAVETSNQGFASRTGADRDALEELLNDLAFYTAETALQSLTSEDVKKLAGPLAFWPEGMDYEDLSDMLNVEIVAGSTGKPQSRVDKDAWATLLPIVQEYITQIPALEAAGVMGDPVAAQQAKAFRNLLRETLKRLDDRMSIDQILPPMAIPKIPPAVPGAAGVVPGQSPTAGGIPPTTPSDTQAPPPPPLA